jgi:hypothetical protein
VFERANGGHRSRSTRTSLPANSSSRRRTSPSTISPTSSSRSSVPPARDSPLHCRTARQPRPDGSSGDRCRRGATSRVRLVRKPTARTPGRWSPGRDHEIFRFVPLGHHPHRLHVLGVAPVSLGVQVPEVQPVLQARLAACHRPTDRGSRTSPRVLIDSWLNNPVAGEQVVRPLESSASDRYANTLETL